MRFDIIVVLNLPILRMRRTQLLTLVEKHSSSQREQDCSQHLGRYHPELRVRIAKSGHTASLVMVLEVERAPSYNVLARIVVVTMQGPRGITVIPKHMLLPDPKHLFEFPELPFPRRPFIPVRTVQLHMVELEDH